MLLVTDLPVRPQIPIFWPGAMEIETFVRAGVGPLTS